MGKLSLTEQYYNPKNPASFGSARTLRKELPHRKNVKKWLSLQTTHSLHKPIKKKFVRRKTIVAGIDSLWQMDLIDVLGLKRYNKPYSYILTCIDVFSKYAWAVPIKNKKAVEIIRAFKTILKKGRKPYSLQTDKGSEFRNGHFQKFLKLQNIEFYTSENADIKCAIVERYNRSLKEKMWKYFTFKNTLKYVPVLEDMVYSYNRTYHSGIKRKPIQVNRDNQEDVWQTLYGKSERRINPPPPKLKVGDNVRISKTRLPFDKGYRAKWSEEVFIVEEVLNTSPHTYKIKDLQGEVIKGSFYELELQHVPPQDVFRVEKVLKTRKTKGGKTEVFVRWVGYPEKFNQWIPKKNLTK